MLKKDYQQLIQNKPWEEMEKYFNSLPTAEVSVLHRLDIDTQQWIDFSVENFELAQQKWESPKDHYSDYNNKWATINNQLGRNEHNTHELNYGMNGDTNQKLKELLGTKNIEKLNVIPSSVLIRLIVK